MSALEDERSRMRFARIAANYGEWEWNIATGEVCWCEELYRVFGCNPGQKVTLSVWLDLIHEEDRGTAEVAINRAAKGETPFRTQYRICRSGEVRWLETIGNTLEETSDPSSHILTGITLDITERKQLEGDLRETNERYERDHRLLDALMQYIPEGVTIADAPDVKIRRVSRFGQQLVGRPKGSLEEIAVAEDLHARRWGILRPDGTLPLDGELPLTRSTKHGEIVEGEEWLLAHPDGRRTWILCNSGPIRDAAGSITGGVIAWRDITERKNVERALRESEERFRMASQVANEAIWELNVETKEVSGVDPIFETTS